MLIALALFASTASKIDCNVPQTSTDVYCAGEYSFAVFELKEQFAKLAALMKQRDKDIGASKSDRPGLSEALSESQRAWLRYRDAQCQIEGTMSGCFIKLTKARTQQLKDLEQSKQ